MLIGHNDSEAAKPAQSVAVHGHRMAQKIVWLALLGLTFGLFVAGKVALFNLDAIQLSPDTHSYVMAAGIPLFSTTFFNSSRPFTIPLLYKMVGLQGEASLLLSSLRRLTTVQLALSISCWTLLSGAVAVTLRRRVLRLVGFALILLFALSPEISQWDKLPLSESASFSLFAAALGLALLGIEFAPKLKGLGKVVFPLSGVFLLVIVLFSFSRDANAYLLLTISGLLLVGVLAHGLRHGRVPKSWAIFAFALMGLFLVQLKSANSGHRWLVPFQNVLHDRILPSEAAVHYFQEAGMPLGSNQREGLLKLDHAEFRNALDNSASFKPLNSWIRHAGRSVYFGYLLRHPYLAFSAPLSHYASLVSPLSSEYRSPKGPDPEWVTVSKAILYPRSPALVLLLAVAALVMAVLSERRQRRDSSRWILPVLLILSAFPMAMLVWYADSLEVERHATQIAIQLRLGIWMSLLLGGDQWIVPKIELPLGPYHKVVKG